MNSSALILDVANNYEKHIKVILKSLIENIILYETGQIKLKKNKVIIIGDDVCMCIMCIQIASLSSLTKMIYNTCIIPTDKRETQNNRA